VNAGLDRVVSLRPGARFVFDGEAVEVTEMEGGRLTLRDARDRWRTVGISVFLSRAVSFSEGVERASAGDGAQEAIPVGTVLAALTAAERQWLGERAAHVREVLSGYRSGTPELVAAAEPRPEYSPEHPLSARLAAKSLELGVSERTLHRWLNSYRLAGEAGLVDARGLKGRGSLLDPRWEETCRLIIAERVAASTPTTGALLRAVNDRLDEQYGSPGSAGAVPRPSKTAAYRRLQELAKGTNAVKGSAKGRRSIAERPKGVYGRLRANRPGEYVVLDTQDLDVFAMEAVTCRWVRVQLTVAQDLFTRCILGLRVTAVSTKAVDVAGVLYQVVAPASAPPDWPAEAIWPYHGIPSELVFTEDDGSDPATVGGEYRPVGPVCAPEALVIDHGKAFLSAHVISVCTRLGISIQPAQPRKPTDKPTVERFFKTLREGLIQYLPAYKGPDVFSRGERLEDAAFLFVHELEDVIREWVALVYHRTRHAGLVVPGWPQLGLSPNEMYDIGLAKAGLLRVPARPDLVYDFLPVAPRTIQHYGVEVNGLRYNGPVLDAYRNSESPYRGALDGKWPIRFNPDDVRWIYFQDPADRSWHALEWEHAPGLGAPFSAEATRHARRLAAAEQGGRWPDEAQALGALLSRWQAGMVNDRRERRMALRLGAERAALPAPEGTGDAAQVRALPTLAALSAGGTEPSGAQAPSLRLVPGPWSGAQVDPGQEPYLGGDDDEAAEVFEGSEPGLDEGFYDDAFEVLE
jgi:transposase InsO family protein